MRLTEKNIQKYCHRYNQRYENTPDQTIEEEMKKRLKQQRFLCRDDLITIGTWKSKRPRRWYEHKDNDEVIVKEITAFSFDSKRKSERARIEALIVLKGVSWPVASTILHFAFPDRYPILDYRALWSLKWQQPTSYDYSFWQNYCDEICEIAKKFGFNIRDVDKALWMYSKMHQKK